MGPLTGDELVAWVAASCQAQGLGLKVTDPATVAQVVALLGATAAGSGRRGSDARSAGRRRLQAPHRADAGRVEAPRSRGAGVYDGVVEHGFHHGDLLEEGEAGPLSA